VKLLAVVFAVCVALVATMLWWPQAIDGRFFIMHDRMISSARSLEMKLAIALVWIAVGTIGWLGVRARRRARS